MGLLKTLFARAQAKVKLVTEYKQLVIKVYEQEQKVEELRQAKEEAKYNSDVFEAELYISKKDGVEKVTEAYIKAFIECDNDAQAKRTEVIEAEHKYKLALVDLTHLYNQLQAVKVELTA